MDLHEQKMDFHKLISAAIFFLLIALPAQATTTDFAKIARIATTADGILLSLVDDEGDIAIAAASCSPSGVYFLSLQHHNFEVLSTTLYANYINQTPLALAFGSCSSLGLKITKVLTELR